MFKCSLCSKCFCDQNSLSRHRTQAHLDASLDVDKDHRGSAASSHPTLQALLQAEEEYIADLEADLDAKSGASLKLTILNKEGRIWTMVAGGGASVIYSDTICELGGASELANCGEYSGAPSETQTYEYARIILGLMTEGPPRPDGKVLIIGGSIANFTNVAATFKGIVKALQQYQSRLQEHSVSIIVRRGGPNYQEGLRVMKDIGSTLGVPIHVFGPETKMTAVVGMALGTRPVEPAPAPTYTTGNFLLPGGSTNTARMQRGAVRLKQGNLDLAYIDYENVILTQPPEGNFYPGLHVSYKQPGGRTYNGSIVDLVNDPAELSDSDGFPDKKLEQEADDENSTDSSSDPATDPPKKAKVPPKKRKRCAEKKTASSKSVIHTMGHGANETELRQADGTFKGARGMNYSSMVSQFGQSLLTTSCQTQELDSDDEQHPLVISDQTQELETSVCKCASEIPNLKTLILDGQSLITNQLTSILTSQHQICDRLEKLETAVDLIGSGSANDRAAVAPLSVDNTYSLLLNEETTTMGASNSAPTNRPSNQWKQVDFGNHGNRFPHPHVTSNAISAIPPQPGVPQFHHFSQHIPEAVAHSGGTAGDMSSNSGVAGGYMADSSLTCPSSKRRRSAFSSPCYSTTCFEIINNAQDVRGNLSSNEFRANQNFCYMLCRGGPKVLAWKLAATLYTTDELVDHNYAGTNGKPPLSPRRKHAIEHALFDFQGPSAFIENLAAGRTSINKGIMNIKRKSAQR